MTRKEFLSKLVPGKTILKHITWEPSLYYKVLAIENEREIKVIVKSQGDHVYTFEVGAFEPYHTWILEGGTKRTSGFGKWIKEKGL